MTQSKILPVLAQNLQDLLDQVMDADSDLSQQNAAHRMKPVDGIDCDLSEIVRDLLQSHVKEFSFLSQKTDELPHKRKILRIYSRDEIKRLVRSNLIPEYQNERIINAVTDVFYSIHVGN